MINHLIKNNDCPRKLELPRRRKVRLPQWKEKKVTKKNKEQRFGFGLQRCRIWIWNKSEQADLDPGRIRIIFLVGQIWIRNLIRTWLIKKHYFACYGCVCEYFECYGCVCEYFECYGCVCEYFECYGCGCEWLMTLFIEKLCFSNS